MMSKYDNFVLGDMHGQNVATNMYGFGTDASLRRQSIEHTRNISGV